MEVNAEIKCLGACIQMVGCRSVNMWSGQPAGHQCELNNATITSATQADVSNTGGNEYYELDISQCIEQEHD